MTKLSRCLAICLLALGLAQPARSQSGYGGGYASGSGASFPPNISTQDLLNSSGGSSVFAYDQWKANTASSSLGLSIFYSQLSQVTAKQTIVVTVSSIQYVEQATTPGTTSSPEPSWNTATNGTTSDGTATWTTLGKAIACDFSRYQRCQTEQPTVTPQLVFPIANPATSGTVVDLLAPSSTSGRGTFIFPSPLFTGMPLGSHAQFGGFVPGMKFRWNGTTYDMEENIAATDWGSGASGSGTTSLTASQWNNVGSSSVSVASEYTPPNGIYSTDWLCTAFVTNSGVSATTFNIRIEVSGSDQVEQDGITIAAGATVEAVLPYIAVQQQVIGASSLSAACQVEPASGATLVLAQYQGSFPSTIMTGGILPAWAE